MGSPCLWLRTPHRRSPSQVCRLPFGVVLINKSAFKKNGFGLHAAPEHGHPGFPARTVPSRHGRPASVPRRQRIEVTF
jgi:hypothetical protein